MHKKKRVVVTGVGPLCSLGKGKREVFEGIKNFNTNVRLSKMYFNNEYLLSFYKHNLKYFNIGKFNIDKKKLNDLEEWKEGEQLNDLNYLIACIKLALDDSGIEYSKNKNNIGLVATHENPGLEHFLSKIINSYLSCPKGKRISKKSIFNKFYESFDKAAYDLQTFMVLFHIAKIFDLHGFSLFINNACASGLFALESAFQIIKSGKCDIVVVAGADCPGVYKYLWLEKMGLYARDGKIKPFAINRNGFVFGEGGAALILEDFEHAIKRKACIYAEFLSSGFALDSWKVALPNVSENFYFDAIIKSLREGMISSCEIDLINTHGVGTGIIDQYEAKTLTDIFSQNFKRPFVTALKPYVGHNLGGCALLEIVLLLIALENNFVPPVLNTEEVDPKLKINIVTEGFYSKKINTILKIACGFGGYNGSIVLKRKIK